MMVTTQMTQAHQDRQKFPAIGLPYETPSAQSPRLPSLRPSPRRAPRTRPKRRPSPEHPEQEYPEQRCQEYPVQELKVVEYALESHHYVRSPYADEYPRNGSDAAHVHVVPVVRVLPYIGLVDVVGPDRVEGG